MERGPSRPAVSMVMNPPILPPSSLVAHPAPSKPKSFVIRVAFPTQSLRTSYQAAEVSFRHGKRMYMSPFDGAALVMALNNSESQPLYG